MEKWCLYEKSSLPAVYKAMNRATIIVLDSLGIGAGADAKAFGDVGADTLGHIAEVCFKGGADSSQRHGPLKIPHLTALGLGLAAQASRGAVLPGIDMNQEITGLWGYAVERSTGKDTVSGHWELAGVPALLEWGYFPNTVPCFPAELVQTLVAKANLPGILGNCHASGVEIIARFGDEHIRTGRPICYTSGDSVFQIAAHEEHFGLTRLNEICRLAHELLRPKNICRVIARPFTGETPENFRRTKNRRDYATPPPAPTLLDRLFEARRQVIAIGKISDIYAHQGITVSRKVDGNNAIFEATIDALNMAGDGDLVIANLVDFDSLYGHRRDVSGYAAALEEFDRQIPKLKQCLLPGDLVIITADHGCDPTFPGSDHTREHVPVIAFGPTIKSGSMGVRSTFADVGATVAQHLGIKWRGTGSPFY